jgi:hypothetical protein
MEIDNPQAMPKPLVSIYGRSSNGSFYRRITRRDLGRPQLIILATTDKSLSVPEVADFLHLQCRLNFILAIATKFYWVNNQKIIYAWVDYRDEIERFLNEIDCGGPLRIQVGQALVSVTLANDLCFGSINASESETEKPNPLINLHFSFEAAGHLSPSSNIRSILDVTKDDPLLLSSIAGVHLRFNPVSSLLSNYGSFLLSSQLDISAIVSTLAPRGFAVTPSTYSSYILPRNVVARMRLETSGKAMINESFYDNNYLINAASYSNDPMLEQHVPVTHVRFNSGRAGRGRDHARSGLINGQVHRFNTTTRNRFSSRGFSPQTSRSHFDFSDHSPSLSIPQYVMPQGHGFGPGIFRPRQHRVSSRYNFLS